VANGAIDVIQIDPAALRFDPNQILHAGSLFSTDLVVNAVFGFNSFYAGIACGYAELKIRKRPLCHVADCELVGRHPG